MLAAMRSVDDVHVRALLDQRAQRADVPATRFSAFSDRSDSPSLYSHVSNSYPRSPPAFHNSPFTHLNDFHDTGSPTRPVFGHSPAHRFDDPNASELDLSDDRSLSESGSGISPQDEHGDGDYADEEGSSAHADESLLESRLSLMGPKMRVHSRAPWEVDEDPDRDSLFDDGGADNLSIFGGKNKTPKFAMMRGLAFGAKSPVPRKSSDSASTSKGKASFETSSGSSITTGGAIQALAQASMSNTSLAAMPNHLLVPRPIIGRERSLSISSAGSDALPPLPSPRSAVFSQRSSGAESPRLDQHTSSSPSRPSYTAERSESPSPFHRERKGSFVHPYANPTHLKPYDRTSFIDPLGEDPKPSKSHTPMSSKDSSVTLASEETVTFSHSTSTATSSAFSSSTADLDSSTSATSQFSSLSNMSAVQDGDLGSARDLRFRRETKLGPIGQPTVISQSIFPSSAPYTLISLEQAQEKAKQRNRSATMGEASGPRSPIIPSPYQVNDSDPAHSYPTPRVRTTSGTSKLKYALSHVTVDDVKGDSGPTSPISGSSKQPSPVGHPGGKVLKQKRSGFMKLFNTKEKQVEDQPPPVPSLHDARYFARSPDPIVPHSIQPPSHQTVKQTLHRVPVPAFPPAAPSQPSEDARVKKAGQPMLSIKVISPPDFGKRPDKPVIYTNSLNVDRIFKSPSPKPPISAPPTTTNFTGLSVRPMSSFFESTFSEHLVPEVVSAGSSKIGDMSSLTSPTSYSSDGISPTSAGSLSALSLLENNGEDDPAVVIAALKVKLRSSRRAWQQQVWELEGQIRDLKEEVHQLQDGDKCETCGRGIQKPTRQDSSCGVIHRPRAKTGTGMARFASGNDC